MVFVLRIFFFVKELIELVSSMHQAAMDCWNFALQIYNVGLIQLSHIGGRENHFPPYMSYPTHLNKWIQQWVKHIGLGLWY